MENKKTKIKTKIKTALRKNTLVIVAITVLLSGFSLLGVALNNGGFSEKSPVYSEELSIDTHDYGFYKTLEPSCTRQGADLYKCPYCGDISFDNVKANLGGHHYENGVCTVCGVPEGLYYEFLTFDDVIIYSYNGDLSDFTIPSTVEGVPVTSIAENAFAGKSCIKTLNLPETVKSIGNYAFAYCPDLKTVKISGDTVTVPECAFYGCPELKTAVLSGDLKNIGNLAFGLCEKLETVSLPVNIGKIDEYAFVGCNGLKGITVFDNAEYFGEQCIGFNLDNDYNPVLNKDFTMYGISGSEAEKYANDNGVKFVAFDLLPVNGTINGETKTLFFDEASGNITDMVSAKAGSTFNTQKAKGSLFGTGSTVCVSGSLTGSYSIIIKGDIDGDGVRDVIDASLFETILNNNCTSTVNQRYAANGCLCDDVDIRSYQNVVNLSLSE